MDISEAWAGLDDAGVLADALDDHALAERARQAAGAMRNGIEALWDPATSAFDWSESAGGARNTTSWGFLYPDSMEQVWTVFDGVTTRSQARVIIADLDRHQPTWAEPTALAELRGGAVRQAVGYWPAAAIASALARRPDPVAVARIAAAVASAKRAWPFTVGVAGQLIIAAAVTTPAVSTSVPGP